MWDSPGTAEWECLGGVREAFRAWRCPLALFTLRGLCPLQRTLPPWCGPRWQGHIQFWPTMGHCLVLGLGKQRAMAGRWRGAALPCPSGPIAPATLAPAEGMLILSHIVLEPPELLHLTPAGKKDIFSEFTQPCAWPWTASLAPEPGQRGARHPSASAPSPRVWASGRWPVPQDQRWRSRSLSSATPLRV